MIVFGWVVCDDGRTVLNRWDAHIIDRQGDQVLVHYVGGTDDEDEWIPKRSERLRYTAPRSTPRSTPQISAMKDVGVRMSLPPCGAVSEETGCMMPPELNLADDVVDVTKTLAAAPPSPDILLMQEHMPELDLLATQDDDDDGDDECVDAECVLPTTIDVVKANLGDMEQGLVELVLNSSGRDLSFQWYEGDEAIPGACNNTLLLVNSGGVGGRIRCLVQNKYGASWIKCPVLLPAAPEEALQELDALNAPGFYRLACRCASAVSTAVHCPVAIPDSGGLSVGAGMYAKDWRRSCARSLASAGPCAAAPWKG